MASTTSRALLTVAALVAAANGGMPRFTDANATVSAAVATASSPTVEVGWISREPRLRAPATVDGPRTDGWPAEGSVVQWIGHLLNRGTTTAEGVPFVWTIDGDVQSRGVVDLPPGDTEIVFPWRWTFERHQIDLAIAEDNHVTIDSDALSMAFYVERTVYAKLLASSLGSFEHRMQEQIPYWNTVLADAVHPSTPDGAVDRLRLDRVIVSPDGAPIPDDDYFYTDLFWRFTSGFFEGQSAWDQTVVLHEVMHQRGLVDNYAYEVVHHLSPSDDDGRVNVVDNGKAVAGTFLMPAMPDTRSVGGIFVYQMPIEVEGLMAHNYYRGIAALTEVCANGLNLWHGRRSPVFRRAIGNGIVLGLKDVQPESYVHRLPARTAVTFAENGIAITGGVVDVFLDQNGNAYRDTYSAEPQLTLAMDADGAAMVPGDVLKNQPPWRQPPKAQTILFRVRTPSARAYVFVPVWHFNRLYFRDGGGDSQLQVAVKMIRY